MERELQTNELIALKEIAETLNISNDMHQMLEAVLIKLLEVTGLTTGWIFLVDEEPDYICVADHHLPEALMWNQKAPMCEGRCWCLGRFWDKKLKHAVNIINCKRIEDAIENDWGDTEGIHHHATVPLEAGGELFGILNVAAPGKERFTDNELALLQSVAYQIGTAVNRTKLYRDQEKRAKYFMKLGEVSQQIGMIREYNKIPGEVVSAIASAFEWPSLAFFAREGNDINLRAVHVHNQLKLVREPLPSYLRNPVEKAFHEGRTIIQANQPADSIQSASKWIPAYRSAIAVPIRYSHGSSNGVLCIFSPKNRDFDHHDADVLQSVADHVSVIMENIRLNEQRRELARMEERNRLARDLHDSVSQNLFSLTLIARGAESFLSDEQELAHQSLQEVQILSQNALKEMRSLIWQLRPVGLEQGLITSIKRYGEGLGLTVEDHVEGVHELPCAVEEALWRIAQESLNNVKKHAGTNQAFVKLKVSGTHASLKVIDNGSGFSPERSGGEQSFGMSTMRERAELLGGTFRIMSQSGQTAVEVSIPFFREDVHEKRNSHEN